jgi:SAM-dependent methyltransferase
MRHRLLELLKCAACGNRLDLTVYSEIPERFDPPAWAAEPGPYLRDIQEGTLTCKGCRSLFPVVQGVPRLYPSAWKEFKSWQALARKELPGARAEDGPEPEWRRHTRASFSKEWAFHKPGDVTWMWRIPERLAFFREEVGADWQPRPGALVLDAGCGNGELTNALTSLGVEVVGLDLSTSVVRAESLRTSAAVHYVQGDVVVSPLGGEFDLIYSSGVLHYAPDASRAFHNLAGRVRRGGRIYIWLYGTPEVSRLDAYTEGRRRDYWLKPYVVGLPTWLQVLILYPVALKTWARNRLQGPNLSMSMGQALVGTFNSLTPYHRSHHHFEEIREWFRKEGLAGVTLSGVREPGFGVYGDRLPASP